MAAVVGCAMKRTTLCCRSGHRIASRKADTRDCLGRVKPTGCAVDMEALIWLTSVWTQPIPATCGAEAAATGWEASWSGRLQRLQRASVRSGARACRPRCVRIFSMIGCSRIAAMIFSPPPQFQRCFSRARLQTQVVRREPLDDSRSTRMPSLDTSNHGIDVQ